MLLLLILLGVHSLVVQQKKREHVSRIAARISNDEQLTSEHTREPPSEYHQARPIPILSRSSYLERPDARPLEPLPPPNFITLMA